MPNCQRGKIYKLVNTVNNIEYIGSTCLPRLAMRLHKHRTSSANPLLTSPLYLAMRAIGAKNFSIHLIKAFPCATEKELCDEEYAIADQLKAAGTLIYNEKGAGGKHSAQTRQKMSLSKMGNKNRFNYGSVYKSGNAWFFTHKEDGAAVTKRFSIKKFGHWEAKHMAESARRAKYPQWEKPEDEMWEMLPMLGF